MHKIDQKRPKIENEQILSAGFRVVFDEEAQNVDDYASRHPHTFTSKHNRKMQKLFHPKKRNSFIRVAIIVTIMIISIPLILITTVTAFRQEFFAWVMGDRALHVISDNNADFDHRFKLPSMQIEGYEMNLPQIVGNLYTIDYVNSKSGDLITVTGRIKEDNLSLRIDNESEYHITTIQNRDAFYLSKDEVSIFMFEDDFCIYVITGSFDLDLGTELAKSFM